MSFTTPIPTYLFYDIETSGLSKPFDQVFQFAAIRTDLSLNILERHDITIQLRPDLIPSPLASITHRISLKNLDSGISEYQAMRQIHALLNTPGTISLGYNTLTFDDEFLRFGFYRNLLSPYTHQYANQCSRMDLYPMTVMFYLFHKAQENNSNNLINLQIPQKDGSASFKLENISKLNQLAEGPAHNAMIDVEATLELAKRLIKDRPLFDYLSGYFHKKTDEERQLKLPTVLFNNGQIAHLGLLVLPKIGAKYLYQAGVIGLGQHAHYKNQYGWLRLDLPELQELKNLDKNNLDKNNPELIKILRDKTFVIQKKLGEVGFLLPYQEKYFYKIKKERLELIKNNLDFLTQHPEIFEFIKTYWTEFKYPICPNTDIHAALYQSDFWTAQETKQIQSFHQTLNQDLNLKNNFESSYAQLLKITNPQILELGERILAREIFHLNPENNLDLDFKNKFKKYLSSIYSLDADTRPLDFTGKHQYGLPDFQADFQAAQKRELDQDQQDLLKELKEKFLGS